jgi:hypothetical protein
MSSTAPEPDRDKDDDGRDGHGKAADTDGGEQPSTGVDQLGGKGHGGGGPT